MTRLVLVVLAFFFIGLSLDAYYQILDKVVDWQVEGKLAYAAWKTSVWQPWWEYNSAGIARILWSDSIANWLSAITGVVSLCLALLHKEH